MGYYDDDALWKRQSCRIRFTNRVARRQHVKIGQLEKHEQGPWVRP